MYRSLAMTRSVKDLRELICVSRLSVRESDEEDENDLSRPLTSLSIYGEQPFSRISETSERDKSVNLKITSKREVASDSFAVPRPPSSAKGGQRLRLDKRPQSQSKSLPDTSGFNSRGAPLPPVGIGSRPDSSSSSGSSDRPSSGETSATNFDNVLGYLKEEYITEWLQRTTQMLNDVTIWCSELEHFVDFAQFWLTDFPSGQRLELYKLELSIIADELVIAFGDAYREGMVHTSDINAIISAIFKEYPTKLCSAQGQHVFLDILDTLTSHKTKEYKRLLTDTKASTRNSTHSQSLLALRAFALVSIWSSVINFYLKVSSHEAGAEGGGVELSPKPAGCIEDASRQRLFVAVEKGYVSVVHYLLRNGRVPADVTDDKGRTLTFAAVLANQSKVLHFLITKHKEALPVNQAGESGNTPLHTAANWNYVDCIKVLLHKGGADVNIINRQCDDATPLHVAVMQGHEEACEALVSAGASVTASMGGITPLQLAADMGHAHIQQLLLSRATSKSGTRSWARSQPGTEADYYEDVMDTAECPEDD